MVGRAPRTSASNARVGCSGDRVRLTVAGPGQGPVGDGADRLASRPAGRLERLDRRPGAPTETINLLIVTAGAFLSGVGARLATSHTYTWRLPCPPAPTPGRPALPDWVDLAVPEVPAATEFYAAVLGWTFADAGEEYGDYQVCRRDGRAAAGIGPLQNEGQPTVWTTYLGSDAVDTTAKMITENEGTLLAEPFDVPGSGRLCIALDPQGASFGVWQAAGDIGVEIYNEPGALVWSEAALPDAEAGRRFYAAVFGYTYQPVDGAGSDYLTFHRGGDPLGGIGGMQDSPLGPQPHWMAYFMVADTDAAVAAATERDAAVLGDPVDTPYGRMAVITDPQGATFALMGAVSSA